MPLSGRPVIVNDNGKIVGNGNSTKRCWPIRPTYAEFAASPIAERHGSG